MSELQTDSSGNPLPVVTCPTCGFKTESAWSADGKPIRPRPGDAGICTGCGEILFFCEDMTVRKLVESDFIGVPQEVQGQIRKGQALVRAKGKN